MVTPSVYDFDVISEKFKELQKEKEKALTENTTETPAPAPQSDNQGEYYGCGAWRNPYTQIDVLPVKNIVTERYKGIKASYRPGSIQTSYRPIHRVLPGV